MHRTILRFLSRCLGVQSVLAIVIGGVAFAQVSASTAQAKSAAIEYTLTEEDEALLYELKARAVLFFMEQTSSFSGLTRDRAPLSGEASISPASVAASGFALTAWCVAESRGWISRDAARERVLRTVRFVATQVDHERGWLYHFVDIETGKRVWESEASTVDTALYLKGAILAREYFRDAEISHWVDLVYRRVDWRWALNGGSTLSHGWRPESGFIASRWDQFAEMMGLYLLGLGAGESGLPSSTWLAWKREPEVTFSGRTFIHCEPLFTHQYAHAWFDFRGVSDRGWNYWDNSVSATLAQRDWCASLGDRFEGWSSAMWGVTASDSPMGYKAWGGPLNNFDAVDGTLAPCAAAGSLPFAPQECLKALHTMRALELPGMWGRYGFTDAFNEGQKWASPDVIAIDVGISLAMAENLRSGLLWANFMRAPEVLQGMKLAGFTSEYPRSGGLLAFNGGIE